MLFQLRVVGGVSPDFVFLIKKAAEDKVEFWAFQNAVMFDYHAVCEFDSKMVPKWYQNGTKILYINKNNM